LQFLIPAKCPKKRTVGETEAAESSTNVKGIGMRMGN